MIASKSLTCKCDFNEVVKQAYCLAGVMEFSGAVLFGSAVGDTIKGKIINVALFESRPELLMLGFVCALLSSSFWVILASRLAWPVSTTHSIIGAVLGVGIAAFGFDTPDWSFKGVGGVIASWFISPIVSYESFDLTIVVSLQSFSSSLPSTSCFVKKIP
jgi:phosphate/sulfate permease